ncbi:MFS transporter [Frisingicoccus sp.]|jgi:permease, major facilitator family|uniref:MFS transporter n=1 Tax=Frisingicoccus sp. TaxID=1918627 RepID=UPI003AB16E55
MFKNLSKKEISWMFYDWANSAYTMVVTSTIMSLYFLSSAGAALTGKVADPAVTANAYWGFANSAATLVLVLLSPILGTMADYKGKKKQMFQTFLFTGVIFTALLAFIPSNQWMLLLIAYVITAIGFAGSNIFYDAFLVDVSEDANMDRVSSLGFALGYIGSTIPFIICMVFVVLATLGKAPFSVETAYKISFIITALWWIGFSIPILRDVHQVYGIEPEPHFVRNSFRRLGQTLKEIRKHRHIFTFLLAYFFYIDGVDTIIKMATAYGSTIGIGSIMLLLILLVTQFVAFPFAIIYGKLAEKFGTKRTLNMGILTYCVICIVAFFMSPERDTKTLTIMFWVLAMLVGTAQGGIQALSRSYFGRIVPKNQANEFFGFYNIFGKFAAILGPILFGWISLATGKANYGVGSIIILFIVGSIIFHFVPDDREL